MRKVLAVLFTDETPESSDARKALQDAGVIFREWDVTQHQVDFEPPLLISTIGEYKGSGVIAAYAKAVAKVTNGQE